MFSIVFRLVMMTLILGVLSGCAGGISTMSKDDIGRLSNAALCYANMVSPVGFIPLEINYRRLDCKRHEQEILEHLVRAEDASMFGSANIPDELLNMDNCTGISLGKVVMPLVTTTNTSSGWSRISDSRYHQHVINDRTKPIYVAFVVSHSGGYLPKKFMKLPSRSNQLIRFGGYLSEVTDVSIMGCRSF